MSLYWAVIPLVLAALLYVLQAAGYFAVGRIGMTVAFVGYVVGNIGFIIDFFENLK
jgi:Ni/Fe-hydrogenase subunit HybB-like protein